MTDVEYCKMILSTFEGTEGVVIGHLSTLTLEVQPGRVCLVTVESTPLRKVTSTFTKLKP